MPASILPPTTDPDKISYENSWLRKIKTRLEIVADVWQGQAAWFDASPAETSTVIQRSNFFYNDVDYEKALFYLPKGQGEEVEDYYLRLLLANFKRNFKKTIQKDFVPILTLYEPKDLPAQLEALRNNFDGMGNSEKVVIQTWLSFALRDGMAGLLVDAPPITNVGSLEGFRQANPRPYAKIYQRINILDWEFKNLGGKAVLVRLVLRDWEERRVEREGGKTMMEWLPVYHEFTLSQELAPTPTDPGIRMVVTSYEFMRSEDSEMVQTVVSMDQEGNLGPIVTSAPEITFQPLGFGTVPYYADIPLEELARLDIELYRSEADYNYFVHLCNFPMLNINDPEGSIDDETGVPENFTVSSNRVLRNYDVKWVELQGTSAGISKERIGGIREDIDREALGFFTGQAQSPTATQVIFDSTQTMSNILGIAQHLQSAMQNVYRYFGYYIEINTSESQSTISIERIVGLIKIAMSGTLQDTLEMVRLGRISDEMLLRLLKARGFYGSEIDDQELTRELERIKEAGAQNPSLPEQESSIYTAEIQDIYGKQTALEKLNAIGSLTDEQLTRELERRGNGTTTNIVPIQGDPEEVIG